MQNSLFRIMYAGEISFAIKSVAAWRTSPKSLIDALLDSRSLLY